jgi:hypothetical protein
MTHSRLPTIALVALATRAATAAPAAESIETAAIELPDPEDAEAIAQMIADAEASGETIEVVGDRPVEPEPAPTSGTRAIDRATLAATPHKTADDLLRLVPGLYISQHGSEGKAQQFFLRGFDAVHGSDLEVRVAGVAINEWSNVHGHGYVDLGFVIPEVVDSLAARKGSFDLAQGPFATAGSVELGLGVAAADRGTRVGYEVGTTNRHRVVGVVAPADGPREELAAVEAMHDDGFGDGRAADRATALVQTRLPLGARAWLVPFAAIYAARFGDPGVLPMADVASGYFDHLDAPAGASDGTSQRVLAAVSGGASRGPDAVTAQLAVGWRHLRLDENFTGFLYDAERGDGRRQTHSARTASGRAWWRHKLGAGVTTVVGADVVVDELGQAEDAIDVAGVAWRADRSLSASTAAGAVAAGIELRRGPLVATAGARADGVRVTADDRLDPTRSGAGSVGAISPRVAIAWQTARWTATAGYGRGLRPPEARAFTAAAATEAMASEAYTGGTASITTSDAVELGGELRLHPRITVGGAAFYTRIAREALFDHVSGVNIELDGTRRLGGELNVTATPVDWLQLRGDVTAVAAAFLRSGNPVPGAPRLLASAEARVHAGAWTAGVVGHYLGARPLAHGATGSASMVVDALAAWRHRGWELTLQIDNVLGQDWHEGEYHFASAWDPSQPASSIPRIHYAAGRPLGARLGLTRWF